MKKLIVLGLMTLTGVAQAAELYNNGTMFTTGNLSVLGAGDGTLGAGSSIPGNFTLADDFTVGGAGWNVTSLDFFAYQTSAVGFTFTSVQWSILSGTDVNSATVVASGTTAATNGGLVGYRVTPTTLTNTTRAIYDISANIPDITLAAGSYFVTWALAGTGASGPFVPPTIASSGNSFQSASGLGGFAELTDGTSLRTLEMPFAIQGTVVAVPEPGSVALMVTGMLGVWGATRRRKAGASSAQA